MDFRAHRQVLSEARPFFEKLFKSDWKENRDDVVRLKILTESLMADIMDFIYYGNPISIELCVSRESVKCPRDLYVSIFTHYVYSG